jgi:hypothetical protein
MELFKDRINAARLEFEEYEEQKEQLKEVDVLRDTLRDYQLEIDQLTVF